MFARICSFLLLMLLIVNCGALENEPVEPETVYYLPETLVEAEYTFLDEGLHFPIMTKALHDNTLAVLDFGNSCVYIFTENGEFVRKIGRKGDGPGDLNNPQLMETDRDDNIFILESNRMSAFSSDGEYIDLFRVATVFRPSDFSISKDNTFICNGFENSDYYITEYDKDGISCDRSEKYLFMIPKKNG